MSTKLESLSSEDVAILTLHCRDCDNIDCPHMKNGRYWWYKEGCTREVSEEVYIKFFHYMEEVIPFWKTYSLPQVKKSYEEIVSFLELYVYPAPVRARLGKDGKVKGSV